MVDESQQGIASKSLADLTRVVFGEELGMNELFAAVEIVPTKLSNAQPGNARPRHEDIREDDSSVVVVGSIGYENYREVAEFVTRLQGLGIECLVDVRELPISRRRGYAKTALSQALAEHGIEYLHMKGLGNPKRMRDLYKSGKRVEGRRLYRLHLAAHGKEAIASLVDQISRKRCALMCVEHDVNICHRQVVFDALRNLLGDRLVVKELG